MVEPATYIYHRLHYALCVGKTKAPVEGIRYSPPSRGDSPREYNLKRNGARSASHIINSIAFVCYLLHGEAEMRDEANIGLKRQRHDE